MEITPSVLSRAALAAAAFGSLFSGLAGTLIHIGAGVLGCMALFSVDRFLYDRETGRRAAALAAAAASGCAALVYIRTRGAAALTFVAGVGAAIGGHQRLAPRAAWAAGVALIAALLAAHESWGAPGLAQGASAYAAASPPPQPPSLFERGVFAGALVAATALALDSAESMLLGAFALLCAAAGATMSGRMPVYLAELPALAVVGLGFGLAGKLKAGAPANVALAGVGAVLWLLGVLRFFATIIYAASAAAAFAFLVFERPPSGPILMQTGKASRLLLCSLTGAYLALGLPVTWERVLLGGALFVAASVALESADPRTRARRGANNAFNWSQLVGLQALLGAPFLRALERIGSPAAAPAAPGGDAGQAAPEAAAAPRSCCICLDAPATYASKCEKFCTPTH